VRQSEKNIDGHALFAVGKIENAPYPLSKLPPSGGKQTCHLRTQ
jgi:hypothetical protein